MNREQLAYLARLQHQSLNDPNPANRKAAAMEAFRMTSSAAASSRADAQDWPGRELLHRGGQVGPPSDGRQLMPSPRMPTSMVDPNQLHPPVFANYVTPSMPGSRILTVPGIAPVPPGSDSLQARLDFTASGGCDNGMIIGMKGCVVDNTPGVEAAGNYEYASMSVQITFNDNENIITDGESASFVPFCDLFSPQDSQWLPIMRIVSSTDIMTFRFRNTQPAGTGNTLVPGITVLFARGHEG